MYYSEGLVFSCHFLPLPPLSTDWGCFGGCYSSAPLPVVAEAPLWVDSLSFWVLSGLPVVFSLYNLLLVLYVSYLIPFFTLFISLHIFILFCSRAFCPRLAVSYLVLFSTLLLSAVGTPHKSCLRHMRFE